MIDLELRRVASSVNTGRISFITPTQDPDACFISGRYQVSDNKVKCVVQIIQNKLVKTRFEITGESSDLKKLAQEIVQKIDAWTETVSLVKGNSLMSTPRPREAPEYSASSAVN